MTSSGVNQKNKDQIKIASCILGIHQIQCFESFSFFSNFSPTSDASGVWYHRTSGGVKSVNDFEKRRKDAMSKSSAQTQRA